ncbi:hypothetical protein C8R45DRAFT_1067756 [Mycena sanguinolenta]|nr:hypothetical protein C8R45DRAFT_1067756 [Mycena sanguinolenta]
MYRSTKEGRRSEEAIGGRREDQKSAKEGGKEETKGKRQRLDIECRSAKVGRPPVLIPTPYEKKIASGLSAAPTVPHRGQRRAARPPSALRKRHRGRIRWVFLGISDERRRKRACAPYGKRRAERRRVAVAKETSSEAVSSGTLRDAARDKRKNGGIKSVTAVTDGAHHPISPDLLRTSMSRCFLEFTRPPCFLFAFFVLWYCSTLKPGVLGWFFVATCAAAIPLRNSCAIATQNPCRIFIYGSLGPRTLEKSLSDRVLRSRSHAAR